MTQAALWHYTYGYSFNSILDEGLIRTATTGVPKGEKPIAWFSTEQYWEPTVTKGFRHADGTIEELGMKGLMDNDILLCRVGVKPEAAPYRWQDLKSKSGMCSQIADGLTRTARQCGGNPSRWRGSFEPVGREKWIALEFFNGSHWEPFPELTAANGKKYAA